MSNYYGYTTPMPGLFHERRIYFVKGELAGLHGRVYRYWDWVLSNPCSRSERGKAIARKKQNHTRVRFSELWFTSRNSSGASYAVH